MATLPVFPSTGSIPPVHFYNRQGLCTWLNNNPDYKAYFVNYPNVFPYLYPQGLVNEFISTAQIPASSIYATYDVRKVPLGPAITTLTDQQSMEYTRQLGLFREVYAYNSNAYVTSLATGRPPTYYRFRDHRALQEYKASVQTVNKMYPFDAMRNGMTENRSTLGWIIPFPL